MKKAEYKCQRVRRSAVLLNCSIGFYCMKKRRTPDSLKGQSIKIIHSDLQESKPDVRVQGKQATSEIGKQQERQEAASERGKQAEE